MQVRLRTQACLVLTDFQEKKNQELTKAQAETDEFVLQLDEEIEGMQANIMSLQSKLDKANCRIKELEGDLEERADEKKEGKSENTDESSGSNFEMSIFISN